MKKWYALVFGIIFLVPVLIAIFWTPPEGSNNSNLTQYYNAKNPTCPSTTLKEGIELVNDTDNMSATLKEQRRNGQTIVILEIEAPNETLTGTVTLDGDEIEIQDAQSSSLIGTSYEDVMESTVPTMMYALMCSD